MGQRLGSMFGASGLALVAAFAVGCGYGGDPAGDGDGAVGGASAELRKGTPGAINGQGDYCDSPTNKCVSGEGDCDLDSQCIGAGIVCGRAIGTRFSMWYSTDVCWPATCQNGSLDAGEVEIDNGGPCGCWLRNYYQDYDRDGYGRNATPNRYCDGAAPIGWALLNTDCHDVDATRNPGATEICTDAIDQDCDGNLYNGCTASVWCLDNDSDGYPRSTDCLTQAGQPGYRWVTTSGATIYDCSDNVAAINPGAAEICTDTVDQNCDGNLYDGCGTSVWCLDNDLDTYPRSTDCLTQYQQPAFNWVANATSYDCNDAVATVNPGATEVCTDSVDQDCDGNLYNGCGTSVWCLDNDRDAYPRSTGCLTQYPQPAFNWVANAASYDCNDENASINPAALEICGDTVDNDCDGTVDLGCIPATCFNATQDANETGIDCGGFCDVCSFGAAPTSCTTPLLTCGAAGNDDCCARATVYGADFSRSYDNVGFTDASATATVFSYVLDDYEVTVGRFKAFLAAYDAWRAAGNPAVGSGAHPLIAGTGWLALWTPYLPVDAATFATELSACATPFPTTYSASSANDTLPVSCLEWYDAVAFCQWDGGRLPTEAEWNLAAAGGAQQRVYPWSVPSTSTTLTLNEADFGCGWDGDAGTCTLADVAEAGALPAGRGRWGQSDLGGNMWEYTFDNFVGTYTLPCVNCVDATVSNYRVIRGGAYTSGAANIRAGARSLLAARGPTGNVGFRCARGN